MIPNSYVAGLQTYPKRVQEQIHLQLRGELEKRLLVQARNTSGEPAVKVGDHVLLRKEPDSVRSELGFPEKVSQRLLPLTSTQAYQIKKITGL